MMKCPHCGKPYTVKRLPLTRRQTEIFRIIRQFIRENKGVAPSVRDVALLAGITPAPANELLKAIEARGWIMRTPGLKRSIVVIE